MGALTAFKTCLAKTLVWKGRTSRSEYGWFVVATCILIFLVGIVLEVVSSMLLWVGPILSFSRQAILLLLLLPSLILLLSLLSATIRRLHDRGWSGWWALSVIALVGAVGDRPCRLRDFPESGSTVCGARGPQSGPPGHLPSFVHSLTASLRGFLSAGGRRLQSLWGAA